MGSDLWYNFTPEGGDGKRTLMSHQELIALVGTGASMVEVGYLRWMLHVPSPVNGDPEVLGIVERIIRWDLN